MGRQLPCRFSLSRRRGRRQLLCRSSLGRGRRPLLGHLSLSPSWGRRRLLSRLSLSRGRRHLLSRLSLGRGRRHLLSRLSRCRGRRRLLRRLSSSRGRRRLLCRPNLSSRGRRPLLCHLSLGLSRGRRPLLCHLSHLSRRRRLLSHLSLRRGRRPLLCYLIRGWRPLLCYLSRASRMGWNHLVKRFSLMGPIILGILGRQWEEIDAIGTEDSGQFTCCKCRLLLPEDERVDDHEAKKCAKDTCSKCYLNSRTLTRRFKKQKSLKDWFSAKSEADKVQWYLDHRDCAVE
ncbi:unnamed protein product, partial [Prorocentrum cordatum]